MGSLRLPDRVEEEVWSNSPTKPFAWTGLETFSLPYKVLMQVEGVSPVF